MVKKGKKMNVHWYSRGPDFKVSNAAKSFLTIVLLTFVAGGLNSVIALIQGSPELIPQEYVAYTGLILAVLQSILTVILTYKDGFN